MAHTFKGVLSFPHVFQAHSNSPTIPKRFSVTMLFAPDDPQVRQIQAAIDEAKRNQWPNGAPAIRSCFASYDDKFRGKDYYDPRFAGWWALSVNAKEDNKPAVVDASRQPVVDPGEVFSGCVAYVAMGISAYTTGSSGVGAFLNGVMLTGDEPPMGRLDGKPSVDQMFAGVAGDSAPQQAPAVPAAPQQAPAVPAAPQQAPAVPAAPQQAPAVPTAPQHAMTPKANGVPYEQFAAQGWSDAQLIEQGYMLSPVNSVAFS